MIPFLLLSIASPVLAEKTIALSEEVMDLEKNTSSFVLETYPLKVPHYPHAFNPSIIRWKGSLLLSFRVILDENRPYESHLGLLWLNEHFQPLGEPYLLNTQKKNPNVPSRAEDGRLLLVNERLYLIYSNCIDKKISRGAFRVHIGEILYDGKNFSLENSEPLLRFEGESSAVREKNWVPFDYQGSLFLAYSLSPHLILHPFRGFHYCETVSSHPNTFDWKWGILRGGTPALLDGDEYLSFFHTSQKMASLHSQGKEILHYFIGAYRFAKTPPFTITQISKEPIVGKNFYSGKHYKPYWHPVQAIFPCGFIFDEHYIWITYGRQDHECWIMKLDKQGLMRSLKKL
jgi:predicted GH43/DUF377 family glycosyl hydrolase